MCWSIKEDAEEADADAAVAIETGPCVDATAIDEADENLGTAEYIFCNTPVEDADEGAAGPNDEEAVNDETAVTPWN